MTSLTTCADEIIELLQRAAGMVDRHGKHHAPKGLGKNSGRFVSKSPVRSALAEAGTIAEINAAVAAEAKRITGRHTDVDFRGADRQVARELGEGVLRGLEHSPTTKLTTVQTFGRGGARLRRLHETDEYGNARTQTEDPGRTEEIGFNVAWMSDPDKLRASLAEDGKRSRGVRGSTANGAGPMGVAIHEFGHVAASQVPNTHEKVVLDARGNVLRRNLLDVEWEAADLVSDRVEKLTGSQYGNRDMSYRDYIGKQVSTYASWERGELVAEGFADVVLQGDKAPELSRKIYEMATRGAA